MAEKSLRGFAAMDPAKQRAIASKGGRAAHAKGTAHEFTADEARAAGRKGGQSAHAKGTAHEFTPEEARAAGRKGGQSSRGGRSSDATEERETLSHVPGSAQGRMDNSPEEPAVFATAHFGPGIP
jgi:general stress protein YciG